MPTLALAALLSATTLGHGWYDYSVASQTATREKRELLVLIDADWCPACRKLRGEVLSDPRLVPYLKPYVCTMVNVDRQPQLAEALGGRGAIPLLIAYHWTPRGWIRREIRGYRSVEQLASFLRIPSPVAGPTARVSPRQSAQGPPGQNHVPATNPNRLPRDNRPRAVVQLLGIAPVK